MEEKWLAYAKKLQSIAQAGLTYSKDKYDIERFEQIREISMDIYTHYTTLQFEQIEELFTSEMGYQTPKVDVRAVVFKDEKILMVRETDNGQWSLPGGWADTDTSLKEALIKEVKEESGYVVVPKRVLALLDYRKHHESLSPYGIYKIFTECELIEGHFKENIETSETGFFTLENLPPLSLNRVTLDQIQMCFNVRGKPCHEAIFD